jgi:hypothetical protein
MPVITVFQALNLSRNFPDLRVDGETAPVSVKLKQNGVYVLEETYMNDSDGGFTLKLKDLLHTLLEVPLITASHVTQMVSSNWDDFWLYINNIDEYFFRVIKSGVAITDYGLQTDYATLFLKNRFLTWQPSIKEVTSLENQRLAFFSSYWCEFKWQLLPSLTTSAITFYPGTAYTINVGNLDTNSETITGIKVWCEYADLSKSREQQYNIVSAKSLSMDKFLFENSLGGIDTVEFSGALTESDEHDVQKAVINDEMQEYGITYNRVYKKESGYIVSEAERLWLRDFFGSLQKWHYYYGQYRRIYLKSWDNASQKQELNSFTFTFQYSKDDGTNYIP